MTSLFDHEVAKSRPLFGDANGQLSLSLIGGGRSGLRKPYDLSLERFGDATAESFHLLPMQAYRIAYSGAIETLHQAVTKLNGTLFYCANESIVVIPSDGHGLVPLEEILKSEDSGAIVWGAALGPP